MAQEIINVGESANDGSGESLRSAFQAVNNNFAQIWSAGPVNTNVVISGNTVTVTGTNNNLVLAGNGIGNVQVNSSLVPGIDGVYDIGDPNARVNTVYATFFVGNGSQLTGVGGSGSGTSIANGASNIAIAQLSGPITMRVGPTGNMVVITSSVMTVDGNVTAAYFTGDGGGLTNVAVNYSNANVATYLPVNTSNVRGNTITGTTAVRAPNVVADQRVTVGSTTISNTGVIQGTAVSVSGNITAANFVGSGAGLTGLYNNASAQSFLGSGALASSIVPAGNGVYSLGTPTARFNDVYLAGNSIFLGGAEFSANSNAVVVTNPAGGTFTLQGGGAFEQYGNSNVESYLPIYSGDLAPVNVTATGNVAGAFVIGDGRFLSNVTPTSNAVVQAIQNGTSRVDIPTVNGNIEACVDGVVTATFTTAGISVTGNVTATEGFVGNIFTALIDSGDSSEITVTPDLRMLATLTVDTDAVVGGNVEASYFLGNGRFLSGLPAQYSNANVADFLPIYTGNLGSLQGNVTTTANVRGGNLLSDNHVTAVGDVVANNVLALQSVSGTVVSATGNIRGGNINTEGRISAAGNVFAGNVNTTRLSLSGNVISPLRADQGATVAGNVVTGNIAATGNITAATLSTSGNVTAATLRATDLSLAGNVTTPILAEESANILGNLSAANVFTQGTVSALGNIVTSGVFVGSFQGNITGNLTVPGSNTQVLFNQEGNAGAVAGFTYNSDSNTMSVLGIVSAQGNVNAGNVNAVGRVSATANIIGNNINAVNIVSTAGNVNAGNVNVAHDLYIGDDNSIFGTGLNTFTITANSITSGVSVPAQDIVVAGGEQNLTGGSANIGGSAYFKGGNSAESTGGNAYLRGGAGAFSGAVIIGDQDTLDIKIGSAAANANVLGNVLASGYVSASGSVSASGAVSAIGNVTGANITSAGVVTAGGNVTGANITTTGVVTAGGNVTGGNIVTAGVVTAAGNITGNYFIGNGRLLSGIDTTLISNGTTEIRTLQNANITVQVAGSANVAVFDPGGIAVAGNVDAINVNLTGLANVTGNLSAGNVSTSGLLTAAGNVSGANITTAGSVSATGNVTANNIVTTGPSGNITGANVISTTSLTATTNVTGGNLITDGAVSAGGNVTGGNVSTAGVVTATGNVTGGNLTTAGTLSGANLSLTGNVDTALNSISNIVTTANIVGGFFSGDGGGLSNLQISAGTAIINGTSDVGIPTSGGNANVSIGGVSNVAVFTTAGQEITGTLGVSGNVTGANLVTAGGVDAGAVTSAGAVSGAGNVTGGNIVTGGLITATGTVTGGNLVTSGLVSVTGNITANNININNVSIAGNVLGNIAMTGNIVTTGNVSADYFLGNVACASGIFTTKVFNGTSEVNIGIANGNANVSVAGTGNVAVFTTTGIETLSVSASGNVTGANIITAGTVTATGNIVGGNVNTGIVSASGNISGGNIVTAGLITAGGNITGGNVAATALISGVDLSVTGNAIVGGNLTVNGNLAYVNVDTLNVEDPIIGLGRGPNNDPLTTDDGKDRGTQLWYYDSAEKTAFLGYNNATGNIIIAIDVTIADEQVTVSNYGNLVIGDVFADDVLAVGNVTGGNLVTSGAVSTAGTVTADGNVTGGNLLTAGTVTATGNVTGGNLLTAGTITSTGNVTAPYFLGNVVGNISGNINVSGGNTQVLFNDDGVANATGGFTFDKTSNLVSVAGNLSAANISTSGVLTGATVTTAGNLEAANLIYTDNFVVPNNFNVTANNSVLIEFNDGVGNLGAFFAQFDEIYLSVLTNSEGTDLRLNSSNVTISDGIGGARDLIVLGNVTGGNITTDNVVSAVGNVTGGNITTDNVVSAVGNVTGGNITTANVVSATGNVVGGNINSTGIVSATGNVNGGNVNAAIVSATGNVVGGNLVASGQAAVNNLTATANVTGGNITTSGVVSSTANVIGGNLVSAGFITTTGNVVGGNLVSGGIAIVTGNVVGGNINTNGIVSATGNVTGGNVNATTNVSAGGNVLGGNVAASGEVIATGNVTGGNITTVGVISTTANVQAGNVNAALISSTGNVIATENMQAPVFIGNLQGNVNIGGTNTQVLFNDNGLALGDAGFVYDKTTNALSVGGTIATNNGGDLNIAGRISAVGNIITSTGNAEVGNVLSGGIVSGTGSVTGGNLVTAGVVTAGGNVTGGNVITAGLVTATGNIIGNIFQSTNLTLQAPTVGNYNGERVRLYDFANVDKVNYAIGVETSAIWFGVDTNLEGQGFKWYGNTTTAMRLSGVGNLTVSGNLVANSNITGANISTAGIVTATGNVTGGNINTAGRVSAGGNVLGLNFGTEGSVQASSVTATGNITGANVTGNIFTTLIDSDDSSIITVTPDVNFLASVDIDSDLVVGAELTAPLLFTSIIDSPDSSEITVTPDLRLSASLTVDSEIVASTIVATTAINIGVAPVATVDDAVALSIALG